MNADARKGSINVRAITWVGGGGARMGAGQMAHVCSGTRVTIETWRVVSALNAGAYREDFRVPSALQPFRSFSLHCHLKL